MKRSPRRCSRTSRGGPRRGGDRKSTRLNSSHSQISYAVFCLKKKNNSAETSGVHHLDQFLPISHHLHSVALHAHLSQPAVISSFFLSLHHSRTHFQQMSPARL